MFKLGENPWGNGLRLALINIGLAAFSGITFMGLLAIITSINQAMLAGGGAPADEIPFPAPILLLLYALLFPMAWVWFGVQLPGDWRDRLKTGLVGAGPLFALSLLGYVSVVGMIVANAFKPELIPAGSPFVFGGIATLILFAGLACLGLIVVIGGRTGSAAAVTGEVEARPAAE